MNDTNNTPDSGFLQRLKESPRTVSALIIILIVAAAIYAFSDRKNPQPTETPSQNAVAEESTTPEETPATTTSGQPTTTKTPTKPIPEASRTDKGFVEVAQPGDGITHLARRAADTWLKENKPDYEVTAEHRIYIEDYIKKHIGKDRLAIGQTKTINYDLIAEAVNSAKNLSSAQLKHLTRYTTHR